MKTKSAPSYSIFLAFLTSAAITMLSAVVVFTTAKGQQQLDASVETGTDLSVRIISETPYSISSRDGNQKLWSKVTVETNSSTGKLTSRTNSFVELATGSSYLADGQWVNASDQIEITQTGARALRAQHKVHFLGNINASGSIDITLPEGDKHLTSTPMGLSYFDTATGKSVLIAEIKDAVGELLSSGNQVIYPDAFTDVSADLLYINSTSGFEQLIVLRKQLPSPETWGLDPETTVLQVLTEFYDPPDPKITQHKVAGLIDQHLDFGITQMPRGYAFALGSETNTIFVTKQWLNLEGRQFLVESTPLKMLDPFLKELPAPQRQADFHNSPDSVLHKVASSHLVPARKYARREAPGFRLASSMPMEKGVAIDYTTATSQTNYTFQADKTYYVSSNVTLSGTTIFEGGTVIKFTNNTSAKLSLTSFQSKGSPYRMVILTSKDDNTVGDSITGSTGSPTNSNGATYLSGAAGNYSYMRFSYAGTGISGYIETVNGGEVWHSQFIRCATAITSQGGGGNLHNVLFSNCGTAVGALMTFDDMLRGEHITADQLNVFYDPGTGYGGTLTNSILTAVTTIGADMSLRNSTTNSSGSSIYQTAGAAGYYLANSSTNRNAGTTNIITNLLTQLRTKTTYPPIELTNDFTVNTTLSPQAQRDTDTPDLGYHYEPLDYVVSGRTLTNSTLTLTNGIALGTYGSSTSSGIRIRGGGNLVSVGSPTSLNQIVRYNTVQEQSNTNWSNTSVAPCIYLLGGFPEPKSSFRFTRWSLLGGKGYHFFASYTSILTPSVFKDCQFGPGPFEGTQSSVTLTNCLFERPSINLDDDGGDSFTYNAFNNLFWFGNITFTRNASTVWVCKDNLFDQTSISSSGLTHDYNGYVTNKNRLSPNGAHDKILTNAPAYLTGSLGNYYYRTNDGILSTLIDAGSMNATNATLYHYTTTTNQVKEATSTVDIGFHFVATDGSGQPIDTDGDGIADYLGDPNGNGILDFGEIPFGITIENPLNGSVINK